MYTHFIYILHNAYTSIYTLSRIFKYIIYIHRLSHTQGPFQTKLFRDIHPHRYIFIYIYTYIKYLCSYTHIFTCLYICLHTHIHINSFICIDINGGCIGMEIEIYIYIYILKIPCTYMSIYTQQFIYKIYTLYRLNNTLYG